MRGAYVKQQSSHIAVNQIAFFEDKPTASSSDDAGLVTIGDHILDLYTCCRRDVRANSAAPFGHLKGLDRHLSLIERDGNDILLVIRRLDHCLRPALTNKVYWLCDRQVLRVPSCLDIHRVSSLGRVNCCLNGEIIIGHGDRLLCETGRTKRQ